MEEKNVDVVKVEAFDISEIETVEEAIAPATDAQFESEAPSEVSSDIL